jgi:hypothetical protein
MEWKIQRKRLKEITAWVAKPLCRNLARTASQQVCCILGSLFLVCTSQRTRIIRALLAPLLIVQSESGTGCN